MKRVKISDSIVCKAIEDFKALAELERAADLEYKAAHDVYRTLRKQNGLSMFARDNDAVTPVEVVSARDVVTSKRDTYCAAYDARKDAEEYVNALAFVRVRQVENIMRRAVCEHSEEFVGMTARYARTKKAIVAVIAAALEVDAESVRIWQEYNTKNLTVSVDTGTCATASVTVYADFWTGLIEDADSQRAWNKPRAGVDGLTPAAVRRLARERAAALKRVAEEADAYRQRVRKTIDKFSLIGDVDGMRKAATVDYF